MSREEALGRFEGRTVDVLVIGGGITGVGVALDAVSRGLRVLLVEQTDFAAGTSSKSSRMIHGGLRYIPHRQFGLVREALAERAALWQSARYLLRPLPMLLPMYGGRYSRQRMKFGAGLWLYDVIGGRHNGGRHGWHNRGETLSAFPNLNADGLSGSLHYHDAQADDVRLVLTVVRTAEKLGATLLTGVRVNALACESGRIVGAECEVLDGNGGVLSRAGIRARVTINCTGVWAQHLRGAAELSGELANLGAGGVRPSKGIHCLVDRERVGIQPGCGAAFFAQAHGANTFVEPWGERYAILGTTDTDYAGDLAQPRATEADVESVLGRINPWLNAPVHQDDVISTWAGLRPLVASGDPSVASEDLSRADRVITVPGLVTVVGGKLTTFRSMAARTMHDAATQLREMGIRVERGGSRDSYLDGAGHVAPDVLVRQSVTHFRQPPDVVSHLVGRYGTRAVDVLELGSEDPALLDRLHPDHSYLCAEVVFSAIHEHARSADDILFRRLRLGVESRDAGRSVIPQINGLLGAVD